jgi:AMP phosphorylase
MVELRAKVLDIVSNKREVLLNVFDADKEGINVYDRVTLRVGARRIVAIVETTKSFIDPGDVGVYGNVQSELSVHDGESIGVVLTEAPESTGFIRKKMKGVKLAKDEIKTIVKDVMTGNLSDLEIAGFLFAQHYEGFDLNEVKSLTDAIVGSGEVIDFEEPAYDKHSIGGVPGNKVSLLIVPIVASTGLLIPKTSSKAITSPSGTADSMSVLAPISFGTEELKKIVKKTRGVIVWGGSLNLAPADDLFMRVEYSLQINPKAQMMASIMAKKLAVGVDFLVLDLPVGHGTKVENIEEGRTLGREFVELGQKFGVKIECGITYGEQPVGHTVGPALEAKEALEALGGNGPTSLIEKSTALAGVLLEMSGTTLRGHGQEMAKEILTSGKALEKMREIIEAQGGNPYVKPGDISIGDHRVKIMSPADGYVVSVDNEAIKSIARAAGAPIDKGAGIKLHAKRGYIVKKGDPLIEIYAESEGKLSEAQALTMKIEPITVEGMLLGKVS